MKREKLTVVFFAAVTVLAFAASAGAVDGTIEINQAKVLANGGSFPYVISNPGSYRLTGNLTVSANTSGINVTANNVTIDLNGFTITGPGGTSTTPTGINAGGSSGVTVENGTVTRFGGSGVVVGGSSIVRKVHADGNGSGIVGGANSLVEGCTANQPILSGGTGISCNDTCAISGNTASDYSSGDGINCTGNGCVISGNIVRSNSVGIKCADLCAISGNTVFFNTTGISSPDATTGYGGNVLQNTTDTSGGTSLKNNVCSGSLC